MTFICDLDPYPLELSLLTKYELSTSRLSKVYGYPITHRHTYRQMPVKTLPRCLVADKNLLYQLRVSVRVRDRCSVIKFLPSSGGKCPG